jgi:hypothetical protein
MYRTRLRHSLPRALAASLLAALCVAGSAFAQTASSGGSTFVPPPPAPKKAKIVNGRAIAPAGAPKRVKRVIAAANRIVRKPYAYGGGHGAFTSRLAAGYDCSGTVSHALHGGRFLGSPLASGDFMRWGRRGKGRWITVYAHGGHAYAVIAGLRLDTSMHDANAPGPSTGPRWSKRRRSSSGFTARHPRGF